MLKAFLFVIFSWHSAYSQESLKGESIATFAGRVSRINRGAELIRLKIDFSNAKYLKAGDKVEFWNESHPTKRCLSYVEGRSSEYLLMKVPMYADCVSKAHVTVGSYLHLYSKDLENSLTIGKDLVDILLKKRLALRARMERHQREVDGYVEKMDALNKRYEVLRQKLELEWQSELTALEEDKTQSYMSYKHSQARLNELEHKLQRYRVEDENLVEDRWSLDPKLYFKK